MWMALPDPRKAVLNQQAISKREMAVAGGGGDDGMDWLEKYVEKLDGDMSEVKVSLHDLRVEMKQGFKETEDRLTAIINRDLAEMRERDAQRHAEILALPVQFHDEVDPLKSDLSTLKADVGVIKADVTIIKADVAIIKADVATLKADVGDLKSNIKDLRKDTGVIMRWVMGFTVTMVVGFLTVLAAILKP